MERKPEERVMPGWVPAPWNKRIIARNRDAQGRAEQDSEAALWPPLGWRHELAPRTDATRDVAAWLALMARGMEHCAAEWRSGRGPETLGTNDASDVMADAWRLVGHLADAGWAGGPEPQRGPWTFEEAVAELRQIRRWVLGGKGTPTPTKRKRSTERGEGRAKLVAALTKHHKYADGGCLNMEPVGNNELARLAGVSESTASTFFEQQFGGHSKYRTICADVTRLVAALKLLNQEFAPHHLLYGAKPPGENEREDDN